MKRRELPPPPQGAPNLKQLKVPYRSIDKGLHLWFCWQNKLTSGVRQFKKHYFTNCDCSHIIKTMHFEIIAAVIRRVLRPSDTKSNIFCFIILFTWHLFQTAVIETGKSWLTLQYSQASFTLTWLWNNQSVRPKLPSGACEWWINLEPYDWLTDSWEPPRSFSNMFDIYYTSYFQWGWQKPIRERPEMIGRCKQQCTSLYLLCSCLHLLSFWSDNLEKIISKDYPCL